MQLAHGLGFLSGLLFALLAATRAQAYPWMVRHTYQECVPCHLDPSGSGPLTGYGRAMGEELLRTRYATEAEDESLAAGNFLWGVELPSELMLGGDARALLWRTKVEGSPGKGDVLLMQADLEAAVLIERFVASASVGYADEGALGAAVTRDAKENLVSRQHWAGYWLADWALLRGGRMNLPFGIRNAEHTLWARNYTRTGLNDQQQHGVSFTYQENPVRAEIMAILGNYQLRPDVFRERGGSGFVEWFPLRGLGVGASALITWRELDPRLFRETWRHAYGFFFRYATPWQPLVLMGEWDYSFESPELDRHREGAVGYFQADLELVQGMHFIATGEAHNVGIDSPAPSYGGWLSYQWFFAPHADLRFDGIFQSVGTQLYRMEALTLLAQLHLYL